MSGLRHLTEAGHMLDWPDPANCAQSSKGAAFPVVPLNRLPTRAASLNAGNRIYRVSIQAAFALIRGRD